MRSAKGRAACFVALFSFCECELVGDITDQVDGSNRHKLPEEGGKQQAPLPYWLW